MDARKIFWIGAATAGLTLLQASLPLQAAAGVVELSAGFFYNKSNYGAGDYNWTRRWSASAGYHLTETSELEFSYQDVVDRTMIGGFEDTTFHDVVYSINWVQSLAPKDYIIQPYVKAGVGQLNRDASGSYAAGGSPPMQYDQLTAVLGAGLRIRVTRGFGLRAEATTYLSGGAISTWKDNVAANAGVSIYF